MTKWAKQSNRAGWMLSALALASVLAACSKNEAAPVAASGASAVGVAGKAASASVNPALTVSTVMPETAAWPITVTANGSIAAWQEGIVGAEVGGLRLERVKVEVGDKVHKGDVLAYLRQDSINSDVTLSKAALAEAEAMLAEARANASRAR